MSSNDKDTQIGLTEDDRIAHKKEVAANLLPAAKDPRANAENRVADPQVEGGGTFYGRDLNARSKQIVDAEQEEAFRPIQAKNWPQPKSGFKNDWTFEEEEAARAREANRQGCDLDEGSNKALQQ